jgi:hypothetical protein
MSNTLAYKKAYRGPRGPKGIPGTSKPTLVYMLDQMFKNRPPVFGSSENQIIKIFSFIPGKINFPDKREKVP